MEICCVVLLQCVRRRDSEMNTERRIVILYGSQTGTAQDVAERIERDAIRRHFSVVLAALDHYDIVGSIRSCWNCIC